KLQDMRGFLLLLAGTAFFNVAAADAQATLGARPIALGQATSALPGGAWPIFENPAMISEKQAQASFFVIRYYGLSALTDIAAVVTYPTKFGVIGGGVHRHGYHLFNKTRIRAA